MARPSEFGLDVEGHTEEELVKEVQETKALLAERTVEFLTRLQEAKQAMDDVEEKTGTVKRRLQREHRQLKRERLKREGVEAQLAAERAEWARERMERDASEGAMKLEMEALRATQLWRPDIMWHRRGSSYDTPTPGLALVPPRGKRPKRARSIGAGDIGRQTKSDKPDKDSSDEDSTPRYIVRGSPKHGEPDYRKDFGALAREFRILQQDKARIQDKLEETERNLSEMRVALRERGMELDALQRVHERCRAPSPPPELSASYLDISASSNNLGAAIANADYTRRLREVTRALCERAEAVLLIATAPAIAPAPSAIPTSQRVPWSSTTSGIDDGKERPDGAADMSSGSDDSVKHEDAEAVLEELRTLSDRLHKSLPDVQTEQDAMRLEIGTLVALVRSKEDDLVTLRSFATVEERLRRGAEETRDGLEKERGAWETLMADKDAARQSAEQQYKELEERVATEIALRKAAEEARDSEAAGRHAAENTARATAVSLVEAEAAIREMQEGALDHVPAHNGTSPSRDIHIVDVLDASPIKGGPKEPFTVSELDEPLTSPSGATTVEIGRSDLDATNPADVSGISEWSNLTDLAVEGKPVTSLALEQLVAEILCPLCGATVVTCAAALRALQAYREKLKQTVLLRHGGVCGEYPVTCACRARLLRKNQGAHNASCPLRDEVSPAPLPVPELRAPLPVPEMRVPPVPEMRVPPEPKIARGPRLGMVIGDSPTGSGVIVRSVVQGGPAERAGVYRGDIVLRVASSPVANAAAFCEAVANAPLGQLHLLLRRGRAVVPILITTN